MGFSSGRTVTVSTTVSGPFRDVMSRALGRAAARSARLLRDLILTAFVLAVVAPLWLLPWRGAVAVGRCYGRVAWLGWPSARRVGMMNLRRAYGSTVTRAEARRFIARVFANLGQSIAEGIQFARRYGDGRSGWEALYRAENPDLEARLLADPRPKIFVTGHLGSWEITAAMVGLRAGYRGAAIVRRVDNPFLNRVVRWLRVRRASQWIEKKGASAEAISRLRQGHSIAILLDENAGWRGVFVDYFGRPASTHKTAALLSLMTGAPIVLGAAVRRQGEVRFLFRLALIDPDEFRSAGDGAIRLMTARIVSQYEQWVRNDPLQWRWCHWRWKTRPGGCEETYTRRDLAECFLPTVPASRLPAEGQAEAFRLPEGDRA